MFIEFMGHLIQTLWISLRFGKKHQKIYFALIWHQIDQVGIRAVPIIMLLNFLVGIVLTHQGINTLEEYGQVHRLPDIIVPVYVRYIGCLISSLIVAGRSGSAFTSEIGSMMLGQEIDAIRSMNVNYMSLITIPRFIATLITLPMLVVFAIIAGLAGSIFIAWILVDFPPYSFLYSIRSLVKLLVLNLTLLKAFVFGQVISVIACYRGFCVQSNAQILGEMTTKSVVECIFWTIVIDGVISTYYSFLNL